MDKYANVALNSSNGFGAPTNANTQYVRTVATPMSITPSDMARGGMNTTM
jgi:hypothetical protein